MDVGLGDFLWWCLVTIKETQPPGREQAMKISEVAEGLCQEASIFSKEEYIPCNMPAVRIIHQRDGNILRMCSTCATHNIKNRGAKDGGPLET